MRLPLRMYAERTDPLKYKSITTYSVLRGDTVVLSDESGMSMTHHWVQPISSHGPNSMRHLVPTEGGMVIVDGPR